MIVFLFLAVAVKCNAESSIKGTIEYHTKYTKLTCDHHSVDIWGTCHFVDEKTNETILCGRENLEKCFCLSDKLYNLKERKNYNLSLYNGDKKMCDFGIVRVREAGVLKATITNDYVKVQLRVADESLRLKKCSYCLRESGKKHCYRKSQSDSVCKEFHVFALKPYIPYTITVYNEFDEAIAYAYNIIAKNNNFLVGKDKSPFVAYRNNLITLTRIYDSVRGDYHYETSLNFTSPAKEHCYFSYLRKGELHKIRCYNSIDFFTCDCKSGILKGMKDSNLLFVFDQEKKLIEIIDIDEKK